MNKEKAIEFVLKNLGISSFDDLSISYDYIKQNGKIVLNRKFSNESMYVKIKSLIENIWKIENCEKRINELMK
jgi:translation initiation factor 2 beta subunit (eIF-2beta)/eIF-5